MHEICVFEVERGKVEVIDDVFMRFARQSDLMGKLIRVQRQDISSVPLYVLSFDGRQKLDHRFVNITKS